MTNEGPPEDTEIPSDPAAPPDADDSQDGDSAIDDLIEDATDGSIEHDTPKPRPRSVELARRLAAGAARVALDNRGSNVVALDVTRQSAEFDMFVLATGQSRRQLHAISEQIDDELEKHLGDRRLGIEGYDESRWIVLDYGNLVVHLFDEETREY